MININDCIVDYRSRGYSEINSEARICQDIILLAISKSVFRRNVTVKGGIIMRSLSGDSRRATLDIDLDFIKYSLTDEAIKDFLSKLNCIEGIKIEMFGKTENLKQQDYHGKRVYVDITDLYGKTIRSKIDLGVHTKFNIAQSEYSFDVCLDDDGASMLINSSEQIFTEKLRALIKFGPFTTRFKDIFDIYYLMERLDLSKLKVCLSEYIFDDEDMRENNISDISSRINRVFSNNRFRKNLNTTDKNWLGIDIDDALRVISDYFDQLSI